MLRDVRDTDIFRYAQALADEVRGTGGDTVLDFADLTPSSIPSRLLFTGSVANGPGDPSVTRICEFDLDSGTTSILSAGPRSDRGARLSPDGKTIAFLSDRVRTSDFQLYFLDLETRRTTAGPGVAGWVEYLEWSPDGGHILLGVAGHGAELSSGHGAYKTAEISGDYPSWMPQVIGASPESLWRTVWICDVASGTLSRASTGGQNVWEAVWCGEAALVVVGSSGPHEGDWYDAALSIVDLATGNVTRVHTPDRQIALPRVSPTARFVAFIEAISSDREYVAGELRLIDLATGLCSVLATGAVDITSIEWRSDDLLLLAGHRGLETVVLTVDANGSGVRDVWKSTDVTTSGIYARVMGLGHAEDFAFVSEGFFRRPRIATVKDGILEIAGGDIDPALRHDDGIGDVEPVRWQAPDGLLMEGWLLRPKSPPPYATIMEIHGGPILHWRPYWLGRAIATLLLLRRGYAVFLPNPRGSSGRGQDFAARVVGDVGGADTADFLSGIDHLVAAGLADPARLGVTGLSYGGFMTCWLTTQDARFGAAISVGPATNHVSHHLLCNIPQFVTLFVQDHYTDIAGRYYSRSPVLHAHKSKTPTLLVCGDLDRCTPPEEAIQFQNALLENSVESIVVRYPEEGHGIYGANASIDFAARCLMWFEKFIPADAGDAGI